MRRVILWLTSAAILLAGLHGVGRAQEWSAAVVRLAPASLAGDWVEVATTRSWALRRCVSDTRHEVRVRGTRHLAVTTVCVTPQGAARRRGVIKASTGGDGRLRIRYAPWVLAWAPAAWSDFWVLGVSPDGAWIVVGDRHRDQLAVWSRTVSLDEGSFAQALAVARRAGYDVYRVHRVPQGTGASGAIDVP